MLRILAAALAGLLGFFLIFWLLTWLTGSDEAGAIIALPLGFIGVPVLVLKFWRSAGSEARRNRILGAIGMIWGGSLLVSGLLQGARGDSAYAQGQGAGLAFGGLMLAAALYYLLRRNEKPGTPESIRPPK